MPGVEIQRALLRKIERCGGGGNGNGIGMECSDPWEMETQFSLDI